MQAFEDFVDDHFLRVVLARVADIENILSDFLGRAFEDENNGTGQVFDVAVGPPKLLAENTQRPSQGQIADELVDRQIESHPRRYSIDGGKPQGRGDEIGPQRGLQEMLLESDLEFGIQRNRPERRCFDDVSIALHLAVVAAGGRERETLDRGVLITKPEQRRGRFQVDGASKVRLFGAGGIANDRRQVRDRFDAVERGRQWPCYRARRRGRIRSADASRYRAGNRRRRTARPRPGHGGPCGAIDGSERSRCSRRNQ